MSTKNTFRKFSTDCWALGICLLGVTLWSCLLTAKYNLFGFFDWDLGLYSQVMQNLCRGTTYNSLFQTSFLADHTHYIAFLLVPFYKLIPHPLTLIHLEIFAFFAGAFVFYKIAAKILGAFAGLVLMIIYIIHPANVFMLFYEFHFESLSMVFIFLMFYFSNEKKWTPFIITAFILMLIKENMALIVAMFGVYGILFNKESKWRWGGVVFAFGVLFFLVNMFVLVPYFRRDLMHTSNMYWSCYNQFGGTPLEILRNLVLHPVLFIKYVCSVQNLVYLKEITGPFIFLPFYGPQFLIGLPILAQNLLSNTYNMHLIFYHYAATLIPFAAMGAVNALSFIKVHVRPKVFFAFVVLMICSAVVCVRPYWHVWQTNIASWNDPSFLVRESMIADIPKDASVVVSFKFLSHMTQHKELYAFYNVWRDVNYFTGQQPFKLPDSVQYGLIDLYDTWLFYDLDQNRAFTSSRVDNFFNQNKWIVKRKYGMIVLIERAK